MALLKHTSFHIFNEDVSYSCLLWLVSKVVLHCLWAFIIEWEIVAFKSLTRSWRGSRWVS